MIEFSENVTLCLDSRLNRYLDLIANGYVTLEIWLFKVFVFLSRIQSFAPLPFNSFVPKSIHIYMYLKVILQNLIKAKKKKKKKKSVLHFDKIAQFLIIQNVCIKSMYRLLFESVYNDNILRKFGDVNIIFILETSYICSESFLRHRFSSLLSGI